MSKSTSTYYPNYQLREPKGGKEVFFAHEGTYFTTKLSLFGATEVQKAALKWAAWHKTPPVVSITQGKTQKFDMPSFRDPKDLHLWRTPYAMSFVTLRFLGGDEQRIKLYFCYDDIHENNAYNVAHTRGKGTYIEEL